MSTARNTFLSLSCFFLIVAVSTAFLDFDFYPKYKNCHDAENIVKDVVEYYVKKDPGLGAGLIRMFFHDCFVRGCDASILLDKYDPNTDTEKFAIPNNPSLRGFEVIDAAKEKLEKKYPGVVSCADIIAFAARDAAYFLSERKISYKIPSGRLDGRISIKDEVLPALPAPFHNLTQQKALYEVKGISTADMVALLGAHSIGRSHCSSFTSRLYPKIDPTMDPGFASDLTKKCPQNAPFDGVVVQDFVTPDKLDNEYYDNVKARKVLFFSDWSLLTSSETFELVKTFSENPDFFAGKFAESMIKMGNIEVKTGTQGEIRKSCRVVNYPTTTTPPPPAYVPPTTAPPPPAYVPPTTAPPPHAYVPPTTAPPPHAYVPPTTAPPPHAYVPPTTAPPPHAYVPPTTAPPPHAYVPPTTAPPPHAYVPPTTAPPPPHAYVPPTTAPPPHAYVPPTMAPPPTYPTY